MSFSIKDVVTIFLALLALALASLPVQAAVNEMPNLDMVSMTQIQTTSQPVDEMVSPRYLCVKEGVKGHEDQIAYCRAARLFNITA
ncbi:MAG: hypothetical protein QNK24_05400 [Desulfuromusa sp.]|nr:hypothetical protein [Desulfuromusa sp.]